MLTPIDIHNKEFKRSFRGYNEDEIDDFLDQVVNDYEMLYRENHQLKESLALKEKELDQYHQLEKNLQDTLVVAQRTAEQVTTAANNESEQIKSNAEMAAENIVSKAQVDARKSIDDAMHKVQEIADEYGRLVKEKRKFIVRIRSLMEAELSLLDEEEKYFPDRVQENQETSSEEAEKGKDYLNWDMPESDKEIQENNSADESPADTPAEEENNNQE